MDPVSLGWNQQIKDNTALSLPQIEKLLLEWVERVQGSVFYHGLRIKCVSYYHRQIGFRWGYWELLIISMFLEWNFKSI